jgi:hypothetical protein
VDKNQTNIQHGLKALLRRYTILGSVFFDEKVSMHEYLFIMMDSNQSVSPAAGFPSAVLPVQWSTMQNTCMCLEQNFLQVTLTVTGHCAMTTFFCVLLRDKIWYRKRTIESWQSGRVYYWLTWKIWAKVVWSHSTEFHTTMFTYEA